MFKKTYLPVTLISKRVERRLNLYVKKRFTLCLETLVSLERGFTE